MFGAQALMGCPQGSSKIMSGIYVSDNRVIMFQESSLGGINDRDTHFMTEVRDLEGRNHSFNVKVERNSTGCSFRTCGAERWREAALSMKPPELPADGYDLECFGKDDNPPLFEMFVNKLREYNLRIQRVAPTKTDQQIHNFIFTYLRSISRQSKEVVTELLDKLLKWYEQSIKPKPQLIDFIIKLRKKQALRKKIEMEDEDVRRQFRGTLALDLKHFYRKSIGGNKSQNQNERRRVLNSLNRGKEGVPGRLADGESIVRRRQPKRQNSRVWNKQIKNDEVHQLYQITKSRKREQNFKSSQSLHKPPPKHLNKFQNRVQQPALRTLFLEKNKKNSSINGLTLLRNPFQNKK